MDGILPTQPFRGPVTKPISAPVPAPPVWNAGLSDVLALGLELIAAPATKTIPPGLPQSVGGTPSVATLIGEVATALATEPAPERLDALRLQTFAALVECTAKNPEATRLLALALNPPSGNEGAARLHQLLFDADEITLGQLYHTTAMDTAEFATLQEEYPDNIFDANLTGGMLLADVLKDVYAPDSILQGSKLTCGATSVQIILAREAPAEYMRLVTGLAFSGSESLKGGQTIEREADWKSTNDGDRRLTGRLIQPAFMEFANGEDVYHNTADRSYPSDMSGTGRQGMSSKEMLNLLTAVSNRTAADAQVKNWDTSGPGKAQWVEDSNVALKEKIDQIKAQADKGTAVPVLLSLKPDQQFAHFQLVTKIENQTVYGLNPWGKEEPMPLWLFERRLIAAFFQDE